MFLTFRMKLFLAVLLFLGSSVSSSASQIAWFTQGKHHSAFISAQTADDFRVVEVAWREARLQEKVSERRFRTLEHAQKALGTIQRRLARQGISPNEKSQNLSGSTEAEKSATDLPGEVLWSPTNEWSIEWMNRYSKWVREEVNPKYFEKYNLATDCADAAFAIWWIFARENSLPVASHLSGSGQLLTQDSMKPAWARLPTAERWYDDKRFRAALDYLLDNAYTISMINDTYPIAITQDAIQEGSILLTTDCSHGGHTRILSKVQRSGDEVPITVIASTVPRSVRSLHESPFNVGQPSGNCEDGLLWMRFAKVLSDGSTSQWSKEESPFYSKEQYSSEWGPSAQFSLNVMRVVNPSFNPAGLFSAYLRDLQQKFESRIDIVRQGYEVCGKGFDAASTPCAPGTALYEDWSTPSRDNQIRDQIKLISTTLGSLDAFDPTLEGTRERFLSSQSVQVGDVRIDFRTLAVMSLLGVGSSDPWETPEARWGLDPERLKAQMNVKFEGLLSSREKKSLEATRRCHAQGEETFGTCSGDDLVEPGISTIEEDAEINRLLSILDYLGLKLPQIFSPEKLGAWRLAGKSLFELRALNSTGVGDPNYPKPLDCAPEGALTVS
jgi:hypothetical protein